MNLSDCWQIGLIVCILSFILFLISDKVYRVALKNHSYNTFSIFLAMYLLFVSMVSFSASLIVFFVTLIRG